MALINLLLPCTRQNSGQALASHAVRLNLCTTASLDITLLIATSHVTLGTVPSMLSWSQDAMANHTAFEQSMLGNCSSFSIVQDIANITHAVLELN